MPSHQNTTAAVNAKIKSSWVAPPVCTPCHQSIPRVTRSVHSRTRFAPRPDQLQFTSACHSPIGPGSQPSSIWLIITTPINRPATTGSKPSRFDRGLRQPQSSQIVVTASGPDALTPNCSDPKVSRLS